MKFDAIGNQILLTTEERINLRREVELLHARMLRAEQALKVATTAWADAAAKIGFSG